MGRPTSKCSLNRLNLKTSILIQIVISIGKALKILVTLPALCLVGFDPGEFPYSSFFIHWYAADVKSSRFISHVGKEGRTGHSFQDNKAGTKAKTGPMMRSDNGELGSGRKESKSRE